MMDDRFLYFALSDPDFFDVPWAVAQECYDLRPMLPPGWVAAHRHAWQTFAPADARIPASGWKVHVTASETEAEQALRRFAQLCIEQDVPFKILRGPRSVRAAHLKYTPSSISTKLGTAYPSGNLTDFVHHLARALDGVTGPTFVGEHQHRTAPIGLRHGAFEATWVEAVDGRSVPGRPAGDGAEHDDRERGRDTPVPPELADVFAPRPEDPLPIEQVRLLHRTNAGGVYTATLADGTPVVIKEARRHTGLDADGVDAVTRLRHELLVLRHLQQTGVTPRVLDHWQRADAEFLVLEHFAGENLATLISRHHPAGHVDASPAEFDALATTVMRGLHEAVAVMHRHDVAHLDLQPANVVVGADGVRVVDLESASVAGRTATTAVGTSGYVGGGDDPFERDAFALERIALTLHEPDSPLAQRRPDIEDELRTGTPDTSRLPLWRARLIDGMIRRATPDREDRLFPGGIETFTTPLGGHSLASGAAGVLSALHALGHAPTEQHLTWLADVPAPARSCRGLWEGVDGVAATLARLGRPDEAVRLASTGDLPRGLSWARGRAGIALAAAETAHLTDDARLRAQANVVLDGVLRDLPDADLRTTGLLTGWAGVALAMLRIGELIGRDLTTAADLAISRELSLLVEQDGCRIALPAGRVRTGLGHGSAAAAVALDALAAAAAQDIERPEFEQIVRGMTRVASPVAGLMDGLAGHVLAFSIAGDLTSSRQAAGRATWHCTPTSAGWSVLGAGRLRCSDDLASGSAGLALALGSDQDGLAGLRRVLHLPRATDADCHTGP